ncbi:MAG: glutathione peroxidase [Planctomycetota bacterium]
MDGSETTLSAMEGKAFLLVNVASECGFTSQYEGLQALSQRFSPQGLVVIGFPANDFLGQEPGSNEEIVQFCKAEFGVSFPMAQKISVKGKEIHPLYAFLTAPEKDPEFAGAISWNFNKFLVGTDGKILGRFGSRTTPGDPKLVGAVEAALAAQ